MSNEQPEALSNDDLLKFLDEETEYKDGHLFRTKAVVGKRSVGSKLGAKHRSGYTRVQIGEKKYALHRLVFLKHHRWLPKYIDHINGDKTDNRVENLRPCTKSQNGFNSKVKSNNKLGIKGVSQRKDGYYVVQLGSGKDRINKRFSCLEDAKAFADHAIKEIHKEFAYECR